MVKDEVLLYTKWQHIELYMMPKKKKKPSFVQSTNLNIQNDSTVTNAVIKIHAEEGLRKQNLLLNVQCNYHQEIQAHLSGPTK